jgi:hypothetical protein
LAQVDLIPADLVTFYNIGEVTWADVGNGCLVDRYALSYPTSAPAALEALAALGPAAFTSAQLVSVQGLADAERRIVGSGSRTEIIHDDAELRAVARRVLADLVR